MIYIINKIIRYFPSLLAFPQQFPRFIKHRKMPVFQDYTGSFHNGRKEGLWRGVYDDGSIRYEMNYHDDLQHGKTVRFHPNGKVEISENYINGERHGKYERFNTAGTPEETGTFVHGKKDGKWVWYDKYGREGVVAEFKDGQMTSMTDNTAKQQKDRNSGR